MFENGEGVRREAGEFGRLAACPRAVAWGAGLAESRHASFCEEGCDLAALAPMRGTKSANGRG